MGDFMLQTLPVIMLIIVSLLFFKKQNNGNESRRSQNVADRIKGEHGNPSRRDHLGNKSKAPNKSGQY